ncbi:MAG: DUF2007 domain-containing protein [Desulfobacteraceae bacterium]|nr:DUF2007 domain-containing protein [Desulfobacteraceae bacterium]
MKNLIQPENDSEANLIKSLLEENGIYAEIESYHDTAYDGLYQAQYGWGVIRVAEKDLEKAQKIIEEWKNSSPENIPWKEEPIIEGLSNESLKKEKNELLNRAMIIIFVLSVAWNIFFLYTNSNQNEKPIEMKGTEEYFDRNGKLAAIYKYSKNSDFPYEGTEYSVNGEVLYKVFDKNENGRVEKFVEFYENKKIFFFDEDENGISESSIEYYKNGTTIKSIDENENKIFEKTIVRDKKNQIIATIFDKDQDSFNDEIHYEKSNGKKEVFQISIYQKLLNRISN